MALQGMEWIIIVVIATIVLIWGPKKIPELAKGLGRARGEFDKATKEYLAAASEAASTDVNVTPAPTNGKTANADDTLIETARKLGIDTLGKTRAEISQEIIDKYELGKKVTT